MKKGTEPYHPTPYNCQHQGMSIRLKIASDKMDAIISNADTMREITREYVRVRTDKQPFEAAIANLALIYADVLMEMEEETRNDTIK